MLHELITKNRSYRRFYEEKIEREILEALVDYARLSASALNNQPLRYILSCDPQTNAMIYSCLGWAGYLKEWKGPKEGERPSVYILICSDKDSAMSAIDQGIAAQSIMLAAVEKGLGGCIISNVQRSKLKESLNLSERYTIHLVLALGKPKEQVVIEEINPDEDIRYWRDDNQVHHVPKRKLQDILIEVK